MHVLLMTFEIFSVTIVLETIEISSQITEHITFSCRIFMAKMLLYPIANLLIVDTNDNSLSLIHVSHLGNGLLREHPTA